MNIKNSIKDFATKTLFLKGIKCVCCGEELLHDSRYSMCDDCHKNLPFITDKVCKKCGEPIKSLAEYCVRCKNHVDKGFDIARSAFLYDGEMRKLIIDLKFNGKKYLAEYLSWFLYDTYVLNGFDCNLVVPVPMHKNSLKRRGYNQQELLCDSFAQNGIEVDTTSVVKAIDTKTQVGLDFKQRQTNLNGAFKVVNKQKIKGKRVLIVDDIYTTGATVSEVANTVKKAGASSICVLTLCHQMTENTTN